MVPAALRGAVEFGPDSFAARRRQLAEALGGGVVALLGYGHEDGQSGFTGFRQESNFYYLTGHSEPGAALLIAPRNGRAPYREILFLPEPADSAIRWSGPLLRPEEASELGFQDVQPAARWPQELRALRRDRKRLFGLRPEPTVEPGSSRMRRLFDRLSEEAGRAEVLDARGRIADLRSVKSEAELALLRKAADATVVAHRAAWAAVRSGAVESDVHAEFVAAAFRAGCERLAFTPIVASGRNATILHYRKKDGTLQLGDLLLVDAGGEYCRYAADIARTVPVRGRFTDRQIGLYNAVLGAQRAAIAAARPGAILNGSTPGSLQAVAEKHLRRHAPLDSSAALPHALGHHVGLDVHDAAPRRRPLRPGMVVTVEPGIYLPREGVGIRIEDMVEVTEDGCRVLSQALPYEAEEIEELMAPGGA